MCLGQSHFGKNDISEGNEKSYSSHWCYYILLQVVLSCLGS
ncbi:rCG57298 [Rattus norvegicus]|uniref:RCG57298 n=1 Tax=Rattus norvegicus TaxID=10116 RepID=A6JP33_RAT|nr:rCG57298 [Rattus norvegicus]